MGTARGTASRVMSRGNRETRAGSSEQERGGLCGRGSRPRCPPPTPRAVGLTLPRALSLHVPAAQGVQMPRRERGLGLGALAAWLRAVGAAAGRGRAGPAHSAARPAPGPEGGRRRVAPSQNGLCRKQEMRRASGRLLRSRAFGLCSRTSRSAWTARGAARFPAHVGVGQRRSAGSGTSRRCGRDRDRPTCSRTRR